ncbi:MAG: hypothetical protein KGZ25_14690, partial [Planctomycetes bacterium]|nr:hypothetical protein [Planctomycetota bacterium]
MRENNWFCGRCLRTVLALVSLLFFCAAAAADKYFQTPVQKKDLDPDATSQKIEGEPADDVHFHPRHDHPSWVVWTRRSGPGHSGVKFGVSDSAGVRHLRLGFKRKIPVGTVFARGGGQLSVLKPEAPYPGDPGQENHWQKATRVHEGEYSLWILPPNTATRALRFSQESRGRMKVKFQGHLSGVYILKERLINLAPEADIIASTNQKKARFLNDHSRGGWHGVWENEWQERSKTISDKSPESLMLLWPTEVELRGLCALWAGFSRVQVACYKGPEKVHPREAEAEHWQNLGDFKVDHQYPRRFAPNWLDFGETIKTRAVRLTITEPSPSERVHPHVVRKPRGGKRAWLGELMAVHAIQNEDAVIPEKLRRAAESDHPPIPIEFTLKEPGYVTLVIENSEGKRVRNLLSSRRFEAGQHTVWWDGLDETPVNSRVHGIYDIRGRLVEPGQYRVRGLYRGDVKLRYQMTPYSSGDPPWLTPDHKGGWLADHTPPWDALFVPEGPSGKPEVLLTSYVVEHGHGLIGVDLNGKKLWGIRRLGGVWTGGSHLAADRGAKADPEVINYIGSWWSSRDGKGEVRLTALDKDRNQRTVLKYETKNKKIARLGGLAVHNGILVASLPELQTLLFVDASSGKMLHAQTIENPGSIAFDATGRLLMIQADKIRRYSLDRSVPRLGSS